MEESFPQTLLMLLNGSPTDTSNFLEVLRLLNRANVTRNQTWRLAVVFQLMERGTAAGLLPGSGWMMVMLPVSIQQTLECLQVMKHNLQKSCL